MAALLEVKNLKKHYAIKKLFGPKQTVKALDGVSFSLGAKKTLAIVGESGCGKSTLAKVLTQVEYKTEGDVLVDGKVTEGLARSELRKSLQMIFQDPYGSLNPRKKAWQIVAEPLRINTKLSRAECRDRAVQMMLRVGLRPEQQNRYPHMFSGGQRQRLGIARALILRPKIIICDEPVSALDVSIQAQVLNLLMELQDEFGLSYLFISHDLSVVRHISDEVLVIYLGKVVEYGSREKVFSNPQHPYTRALLSSTPKIASLTQKSERVALKGELPSPINPPTGCAFHKRCPAAMPHCSSMTPELQEVEGRKVACHLYTVKTLP